MVAIVEKQNRYLELVRQFPLRPIRSERDLDRACALVDRLAVKKSLSKDEQDYLDVLVDLIEKYEDRRHPIDSLSDGQMLLFLIEQCGITQQELAKQTGVANSTISEIIRNRRRLTRGQIEKLCDYFNVEASAFVTVGRSRAW